MQNLLKIYLFIKKIIIKNNKTTIAFFENNDFNYYNLHIY